MTTVNQQQGNMWNFVLVVFPLLSAIMVIVSTAGRIGVSPDSVSYLSTAYHLSRGEGFVMFDGSPYVLWPPLFPIVLRAAGIISLTNVDVAQYINAIALGATVFVTGRWMLCNLPSRTTLVIGLTMCAIAAPLIYVATYLWSEPLFVLFSILSLISLEEYIAGKRTALIGAGIFAALAVLTRYAGITVLVTGVLVILTMRHRTSKEKTVDVATVVIIAFFPIAVWLIRNLAVSGTLMGERAPSPDTLLSNVFRSFDVIATWFLPEGLILRLPSAAKLVLGAGAVSILVAISGLEVHQRGLTRKPRGLPFMLFTLIYLVFILYTASTTAFNTINDRLLSPLFIPLVVTMICIANGLWFPASIRFRKLTKILTIFVLLSFALNIVLDARGVMLRNPETASGYSGAQWRESETMEFVLSRRITGNLYSNRPDAIYFHTGETARLLPKEYQGRSRQTSPEELELFLEQLKGPDTNSDPTYIIWFDDSREYLGVAKVKGIQTPSHEQDSQDS